MELNNERIAEIKYVLMKGESKYLKFKKENDITE